MDYIDLKQSDLERILRESEFSEEEINKIKNDARHYDRYILVCEGQSVGFIAILEQQFEDPYMNISLDSCDLINYRGDLPLECFLDVLDLLFKGPQITRAALSKLGVFERYNFSPIEEKPGCGRASEIIPIVFEIHSANRPIETNENIRLMNPNDLEPIKTLFFEEYGARFRLVEKMYENCPESCFVYEENRGIKGAIFSEKRGNELYVHQMFVKKSERGMGIDRALRDYLFQYAEENSCYLIKGKSRGNLMKYYHRMGAVIDKSEEIEIYLVRFDKKRYI